MAKPAGMSYARNLLEKYGWSEGKGLGKTESGMVEALKPKLKFDNTGIGHDHAEQFTFNWWELAFNKAASRVSVKTSAVGEVEEQTAGADDFLVTSKRPWVAKLKKNKSLEYGSFVKTETLTNDGKVIPAATTLIPLEDEHDPSIPFTSNLSDEELFKICGGRTAHKAARHGHKLVGKLARVIEQEKKLLSIHQNGNGEELLSTTETIDRIPKEEAPKLKKKKKKNKESEAVEQSCVKSAGECDRSSKKRKKNEQYCAISNDCDTDMSCLEGKSKKVECSGSSQLATDDCDIVSDRRIKKKRKSRESAYCDDDQASEVAENNESESKKNKKKKKRDMHYNS